MSSQYRSSIPHPAVRPPRLRAEKRVRFDDRDAEVGTEQVHAFANELYHTIWAGASRLRSRDLTGVQQGGIAQAAQNELEQRCV